MVKRRTDAQKKEAQERGRQLQHQIIVSDALEGLLRGLTRVEIAAQLGITPDQIDYHLDQELKKQTPRVMSMVEQWRTYAFLRSEMVMARVMNAISRTPQDEMLDHKLVADFVNLTKLQSAIIQPDAKASESGEGDKHLHLHFEKTLTTSGPLYQRMLEETQREVSGYTYDDVRLTPGLPDGFDPQIALVREEALERIEQEISEHLPPDDTEAQSTIIAAKFSKLWREADPGDDE